MASRRVWGTAAGAAACAALLGYALYAEKILGFEPCPLCMFQRFGVLALGVAFLVAALHSRRGPVGDSIHSALLLLVAAFPAYVAGRHVWIQSQPEGSVPSCGASLDFMLDVFPLMTVVRKVLTGAGECAKVDWSLLGLSMPAWVLLAVVALAAWGLWVNLPRRAAVRA
jgi:disulfide bond formation protein DsbB